MNINWIGLIAALATFFGIWFGHVAVRVIEARAQRIWPPILIALLLGLSFEICSLFTDNRLLSTATGIIAVTLFWDSFEFWRQQNRIKKGHASANPDNPRHARILDEYPAATTLDLLDRAPVGRQVSAEEAIQLITDH